MPAKYDQDVLTYPQLTAFQLHEVEGKTIPHTAGIIGVAEKTIDNWKKLRSWNELAIAALERHKHTLDDYATKLIEMRDKKKFMNISGKKFEVDDNNAQIQYLREIALVYGLYAPQKHEITTSVSDAQVDEEIEKAALKLKDVNVIEENDVNALPKRIETEGNSTSS